MRIYCKKCNYKFEPINKNYKIEGKMCPSCGSYSTMIKDMSSQDLIDDLTSEDFIIGRKSA